MSALIEWNTSPANTRRKQGSPLAYFLVFVFALFIGILVFCYAVTKRTNPVFLDVHGKPVTESSQPAHH
jgi:hypothetical protein